MNSETLHKLSGGTPPPDILYEQLFSMTKQLNPLLCGHLGEPFGYVIRRNCTPQSSLNELYNYWQHYYPEAGRSYWSVRSWELLIWQPILIAITAVYGLSAIPPLQQITQKLNNGLVAGYALPPGCWFKGNSPQLIVRAGAELNTLTHSLLEQLQQVCTLRPKLAKSLLSDQLTSALARVPKISGSFTEIEIRAHLPLWLEAVQLPPRGMHFDGNQQLIRLSCCMHYKRLDGELCVNCPRPNTTPE